MAHFLIKGVSNTFKIVSLWLLKPGWLKIVMSVATSFQSVLFQCNAAMLNSNCYITSASISHDLSLTFS